MGEALFCAALFVLGVSSLAALITSQVMGSAAPQLGFWLMVLVLASFAIMGGVGLVWTVLRLGISAERRSALTRQASSMDLFHAVVPQPEKFPTLPPHDGLTNSPGIELAYRLPPAESPAWQLLAKTVFSLVWNTLGIVLIVLAIREHLAGNTQWLLDLFLLPYTAISVWTIVYTAQQIWIHAGMGPTMLEISDHPLLPGHEYQVVLTQTGHLEVNSLELCLICEEAVTYHQGTDVRHETRVVYEATLFQKSKFMIEPGTPFQQTCTVPVPKDAMHSFVSQHNSLRWKLLVRGKLKHWPTFERGFPLVVYPGTTTMKVHEAAAPAPAVVRSLPASTPVTGVVA
ncbi:MAG: hypothetical protein ACO1RA_09490 [Planctomycetaceae bacterium]